MHFGGSIGFLDALASYSVIFSHIPRACNHGSRGSRSPMGALAAWRRPKMDLLGAILLELERENLKGINCLVYFVLGEDACYISFLF